MTQLVDPTTTVPADGPTVVVQIARDALGLVERARFHLRKKGYDPAEVDAFLQECAATLEHATARERARVASGGDGDGDDAWHAFWEAGGDPELFVPDGGLTALLGRARFHLRKKGYDPVEVDALLGQLHEHGTALDAALARGGDAEAPDRAAPPPVAPTPDPQLPAATPAPVPSSAAVPSGPPVLQPPAATAASVAPPSAASTPPSPWDDLVRQVVAASIDGGLREVERVAQLRLESEAMLLRIEQEHHLDQVRSSVEQDCHELRVAAAEQCNRIVLEAERQAERALAEIGDGVRAQLAKVCHDAREELERIAADQQDAVRSPGPDQRRLPDPPAAPPVGREWSVDRPLPKRPT